MKKIWSQISTLLICFFVVILLFPSKAYAEDYRAWSQSDSRWGSVKMGSTTVGKDGCLVTSVTKLAVQAGLKDSSSFNPGIMANALTNTGGFTATGDLYWDSARNVAGFSSVHTGVMSWNGNGYSSSINNDTLMNYIRQGYHMVLCVNSGGHWIAVDEKKSLDTGTIYVMDSLSSGGNADIILSSRYSKFYMVNAFKGGSTPSSSLTNPSKATLKSDKTMMAPGDAVTLTWGSTTNTSSYTVVVQKKNSAGNFVGYCRFANESSPCKIYWSDEGTYRVWVQSVGSNGICTDSNYIDVTVVPVPGKAIIKANTTTINPGDTVTVTWEKTINTNQSNIIVYKKNSSGSFEVYNRHTDYVSPFTLTFTDAGIYRVVVQTYNRGVWNSDGSDYLHTESDPVEINVTHTHNYKATITKAATCTSSGKKTYRCTCGDSYSEDISALGHSYGEWTTTKTATALAAGVQTRICSRCNAKETRTIAQLVPTGKLNSTSFPLKVKQSATIQVTGMANGDYVKTWTSSNLNCATVDKNGKVTGQKKGTATIICTLASGKTLSAKVSIQTGTVKTTAIVVNNKNITMNMGTSFQLLAVRVPFTSQSGVSYSTKSSKIATVSKTGKITAKKPGTTYIYVKSGSKKVSVKVTVRGIPATGLKTNRTELLTLKKGKSFTWRVTKVPTNSTDAITYTTSNKKVATVNGSGKIVGKKKGKATITAKAGSRKVTLIVTIQ